MRQPGKNNRQRGRGRRNGNGQINRNTTLDSNGPDVRPRGNAFQLYEKYVSLGNDASASGERISAEAYYQHADHYFRVHSAIVSAHEERRGGQAENGAESSADTGQENGAENGAENGSDKKLAEKNTEAAEVNGVSDEDTSAAVTAVDDDQGEEITKQAG